MSHVYRFDRFELRPAERRLTDRGTPVVVGARAFDVLVWLVEHRNALVTKQELLDAVWPGVVVEENNLSVQISALRKILGPASIATVAGRGYRFAIEVVDAGDAVVVPAAGPDGPAKHPAGRGSLAGDKPAIAVLPFEVHSRETADQLLADGLVADVTALLARVPGFLVISRASSFVFRGQGAALPDVARQLSVRYLVEGSLRLQGRRIHVSTQLTDAAGGHILWSGQFESPRDTANDLQDGIARGIMTRLQPELTRAEIALIRRQRPDNPDAWSCYHQAINALATHGWGEASLREARTQLRRAMEMDPDFGLAYAYYAVLTALGARIGLVDSGPALMGDVVAAVDASVRLDGLSAEVLGFAGCALCDVGQLERGVELLREALAIDPSNAQARVALGAGLVMQGRVDEGVSEMRLGMRTSPRDRRLAFWGWQLSCFLLAGDRPEEALAQARSAESRDPRLYLARVAEAGALARLGRSDETAEPLQRARQLRPQLTLEEIIRSHGERVGADLGPHWQCADP